MRDKPSFLKGESNKSVLNEYHYFLIMHHLTRKYPLISLFATLQSYAFCDGYMNAFIDDGYIDSTAYQNNESFGDRWRFGWMSQGSIKKKGKENGFTR